MMSKPRRAMLLSLLAVFARQVLASDSATPPIQFGSEQGFVDIDLPISSLTQQDGRMRFEARGMYSSQSVGFRFVMGDSWKAQAQPGSKLVVYWGTGAFESLGGDSDRFVSMLAKRYGLQSHGEFRMLSAIRFAVVGLGDDPSKAMSTATRMKIFLHDGDKERYAEAYVNVDAARGMLEFHEKDPEYRVNVVRALTTA